jgi:AcrR family transcriptional regulator
MPQDTQAKILNTARKLFAEKGFDRCTVDEIAGRAQVNKATIYYHFKDKASLYEKVLEKNLGHFAARVKKAVAGADGPEEKLEAFAGSYAENFISSRDMAPLMLRELASDGAHLSRKTREIIREIIMIVENILEDGREEGIFRQTRAFIPYFMIVGSMNIFTSTRKMQKKFQDPADEFGFSASHLETALEIADLVLHGLKISPEP